jgi:uncharacterized iron-regulated membrane protein
MMATGAILFMVKRRGKHLGRQAGEFGSATARVYRLVEGLNVAAIAGLGLGCIGYLWANRLVPVGLSHRASWELAVFFGLWSLALLHALVRAPAVAWQEQLGLLAVLCLLLPLLNWITVGDSLPVADRSRRLGERGSGAVRHGAGIACRLGLALSEAPQRDATRRFLQSRWRWEHECPASFNAGFCAGFCRHGGTGFCHGSSS